MMLNDAQKVAIAHREGPMAVNACPGSGKTTVITRRALSLIESGIPEQSILTIAFTKSAAIDMKSRFEAIYGGASGARFMTFHAFFFTLLRRFGVADFDSVISEDERRNLVRAACRQVGIYDGEDALKNVLNALSLIKNDLLDIENYSSPDFSATAFRRLYAMYDQIKRESNKIDFDDMAFLCLELMKQRADLLENVRSVASFIQIDEFQDINRVQYETVKLLAAPKNNLFIVGDDDQSIYRFRGCRPEFLLNFKNDYSDAKSVTLSVNYRSSGHVIALAESIIKANAKRIPKSMTGVKSLGPLPRLYRSKDGRDEAFAVARMVKKLTETIEPGEIAILYRINSQSRALIDAFMDTRLKFVVRDDEPIIYEHWICRDICSYMWLAMDRADNTAFSRIANRPKRYIKNTTIGIAEKKASSAGRSMIETLCDMESVPRYVHDKLLELGFYLNALLSRKPSDAIKYIRQGIGYDEYIKEYAAYRGINPKGLFEIANDIQDASADYSSLSDFLNHVDEAIDKAKTDRAKQKRAPDVKDKTAVTLSTIHQAKGLEYDTVFVTGVSEGFIPYEKSVSDSEIAEERRLLYVACTRAKLRLVLTAPIEGAERLSSRFINDIDERLYKDMQ